MLIPDPDWELDGNGNMSAIPTGNIGIGGLAHSSIKFLTASDDDAVQIAGAFDKRSSSEQIGAAIGVRGLSSDHFGSGTGVWGQSSSDSPNANSRGVSALGFGAGNGIFGVTAEAVGDPVALGVGVQSVATTTAPVQYGVQTNAGLSPLATTFNAGIRTIGYGNDVTAGASNYGVHSAAYPGLATTTNIGVYTRALRPPSNIPGNPTVNYGLWAYADNDGVDNKAAYLVGDVEITGVLFNPSDAKLKYDLEPSVDSAIQLLLQLEPSSYLYRQDVPELSLPQGPQRGFTAQNVEQVLPGLVRNSTRPAIVDDAGEVVTPAYHYKTVSYIGLIPVLTQAIQEQQAELEILRATSHEIQSLRAELNELRGLLRKAGVGSE